MALLFVTLGQSRSISQPLQANIYRYM